MTISRRSFAKGAVAVGLLGRAAPARAQSLPKLVVRVDFSPWGMHAGLHLGVEKGWFKEAGLEVEVSDGKGTGIVLPQVASGDVDVGWVQLGVRFAKTSRRFPDKCPRDRQPSFRTHLERRAGGKKDPFGKDGNLEVQ